MMIKTIDLVFDLLTEVEEESRRERGLAFIKETVKDLITRGETLEDHCDVTNLFDELMLYAGEKGSVQKLSLEIMTVLLEGRPDLLPSLEEKYQNDFRTAHADDLPHIRDMLVFLEQLKKDSPCPTP